MGRLDTVDEECISLRSKEAKRSKLEFLWNKSRLDEKIRLDTEFILKTWKHPSKLNPDWPFRDWEILNKDDGNKDGKEKAQRQLPSPSPAPFRPTLRAKEG